jgi:hypothetical protein
MTLVLCLMKTPLPLAQGLKLGLSLILSLTLLALLFGDSIRCAVAGDAGLAPPPGRSRRAGARSLVPTPCRCANRHPLPAFDEPLDDATDHQPQPFAVYGSQSPSSLGLQPPNLRARRL